MLHKIRPLVNNTGNDTNFKSDVINSLFIGIISKKIKVILFYSFAKIILYYLDLASWISDALEYMFTTVFIRGTVFISKRIIDIMKEYQCSNHCIGILMVLLGFQFD